MHTDSSQTPPDNLSLISKIGCGLLMGGADAIPGVSGGTIALILGIYQRFIDALGVVLTGPKHIAQQDGRTKLKRAFGFLIPLGVGVVVSYFLATRFLVGKSESPGIMLSNQSAPLCYGFFFGLVLFSIKEPWKRIGTPTLFCLLAAGIGFVTSFTFVGLPKNLLDTSMPILLFGGAGAITRMLLPGVSGSLFLVIIGQYTVVAGGLHDKQWGVVFTFLAGIVLVAFTFIPLLKSLLRKHSDLTMATLTGLMAGSLRALWPWKEGYNPKIDTMSNIVPQTLDVLPCVAFVFGIVAVFGLNHIEKRLKA